MPQEELEEKYILVQAGVEDLDDDGLYIEGTKDVPKKNDKEDKKIQIKK